MDAEAAIGEEVRDSPLGERRREAVGRAPDADERLDEVVGQHRVGQPQRRKEGLGERADVEDPGIFVDPLDGGERAASVAELAVVVVLNDPRAVPASPVEQRQASLEAQRGAERILVRRRDVGQARLGGAAHAFADVEAVIADRHGDDTGAVGEQRGTGARIAGLLEPRRVPGVEQKRRGQVHRLLGAGEDDDLTGRATHPSRGREILRDRFAQGTVSCRIAAVEVPRILLVI